MNKYRQIVMVGRVDRNRLNRIANSLPNKDKETLERIIFELDENYYTCNVKMKEYRQLAIDTKNLVVRLMRSV